MGAGVGWGSREVSSGPQPYADSDSLLFLLLLPSRSSSFTSRQSLLTFGLGHPVKGSLLPLKETGLHLAGWGCVRDLQEKGIFVGAWFWC